MTQHAETADVNIVPADETHLTHYQDRLQHYIRQSRSERTKREYGADWDDWTSWCESEEVCPLPARPTAVACYAVAMADRGLALSTIRRRLVTIRQAHQQANEPDPTGTTKVKATLDGIRRDPEVNSSGEEAKNALRTRHIKDMVQTMRTNEKTVKACRDEAMVLMGFCGGLRRSELVDLQVSNLNIRSEGVLVDIQRSKTDQQAEGHEVSIHRNEDGTFCPVQSVMAWLKSADLTDEHDAYVFQTVDRWGNVRSGGISGRTVANVIKEWTNAIGLDSSQFSAHSLRSGFVTELKSRGVEETNIMEQTRHDSSRTLRRYDKGAKRFRHDFTAALGL